MSGFLREHDDEGPWCRQCHRAIREDEDDWPGDCCPGCDEDDKEET